MPRRRAGSAPSGRHGSPLRRDPHGTAEHAEHAEHAERTERTVHAERTVPAVSAESARLHQGYPSCARLSPRNVPDPPAPGPVATFPTASPHHRAPDPQPPPGTAPFRPGGPVGREPPHPQEHPQDRRRALCRDGPGRRWRPVGGVPGRRGRRRLRPAHRRPQRERPPDVVLPVRHRRHRLGPGGERAAPRRLPLERTHLSRPLPLPRRRHGPGLHHLRPGAHPRLDGRQADHRGDAGRRPCGLVLQPGELQRRSPELGALPHRSAAAVGRGELPYVDERAPRAASGTCSTPG